MCADKAKPLILKVVMADDGQRLDRWLKMRCRTMSYVAIQKLLRTGMIRVNGRKSAANVRVRTGDEVVVKGGEQVAEGWRKDGEGVAGGYQLTNADKALVQAAVVHEDKALLVLNKPAGLPAQAGGGQVRSLDRILAALHGDRAPKLVHRLDRETTGLIVSAKNRTHAAALAAQLAGRQMKKEYLAVVVGKLPGAKGTIDAPILKVGPYARVDAGGDAALTTWRRLESFGGGLHLLACVPHTGRMNQLRVHLAHVGLPMLGDDKYGGEAVKKAWRDLGHDGKAPLFLHAWRLALQHPQSGETLRLEAPLPPHFAAMLTPGGWRP